MVIARRIFTLFTIFISTHVFSQNFRVYKSWDFESESIGDYTDAELAQDFNITSLYSHSSADIVNDMINNIPTKVMRITHEAQKTVWVSK